VGTHTIRAEYLGDSAHPASSKSLSFTVVKQKPEVSLSTSIAVIGDPTYVVVQVTSNYPSTPISPTGTVIVRNGSTILATGSISLYGLSFTVPPLTPGHHDFSVSYSGDDRYEKVDKSFPYTVTEPSIEIIDAYGSPTDVFVWVRSSRATLSRRTAGGVWTNLAPSYQLPFVDQATAPETVYLYRMDDYGLNAGPVDLAIRMTFTDDPLAPGTAVKAVHLAEIVHATNIVRTAAGLAPVVMDTSPGTPITASSLLALRTAINEGRTALGAYPFAFYRPIAQGSTIAAADLNELRQAVR
jgi:hypothetical protein